MIARIELWGQTRTQLLQRATEALDRFYEGAAWEMGRYEAHAVGQTVDATGSGNPQLIVTHWVGTFEARLYIGEKP